MLSLIVSDLDGTLLDADHALTVTTRDVVNHLSSSIVDFAVATGRHIEDAKHAVASLPKTAFFITSNGARVHDSQHQLIYEDNIPTPLVDRLLALADDFDVHSNVYSGDDWFVEAENPRLLEFHRESQFFYQLVDYSQTVFSSVSKVFFVGEHARLATLKAQIEDRLDNQLSVTFSLDDTLEVMNRGVTKGKALAMMLAHRNEGPSNAIAFGDGMNDREMLELVDHRVVMENAHPSLKASLSQFERAEANHDNGVAKYLKMVFLS